MAISHVYVHVPFCSKICPYCAFARSRDLSLSEQWLETLLQEIRNELELQKQPFQSIQTLYLGGGTPSLLSLEQLERIQREFAPYLCDDLEFTLEMNPENCSAVYLRGLKELGVNRISLGVQSFQDHRLKKLGRCSLSEIKKALKALGQSGIENYSMDLIYAFPDQDIQELSRDLSALLECNPPHVSIYSLQIEEDSAFGKMHMQPLDEDQEADYYEHICQTLNEAGYDHYEISSFAKDGKRSRHNMCYWSDQHYMAFGYGACGYDAQGYYEHPASLDTYLEHPDKIYTSPPDPFLALMMSLRTSQGLDFLEWQRRYQLSFFEKYKFVLEKYARFFEWDFSRIWLNEEGREQLNTILVDFMED